MPLVLLGRGEEEEEEDGEAGEDEEFWRLCCEEEAAAGGGEEDEGTQDCRSICSEGNKSERFTVFARPPNSLAHFQELLRMIYKEVEVSACPNSHHF